MSEILKTYNSIEYNLIQKINERGFSDNPLIGNIQSIVIQKKNQKIYNYKLNQKYDLVAAVLAIEYESLDKEFLTKIKGKILTLQSEYQSTKNKDISEVLRA